MKTGRRYLTLLSMIALLAFGFGGMASAEMTADDYKQSIDQLEQKLKDVESSTDSFKAEKLGQLLNQAFDLLKQMDASIQNLPRSSPSSWLLQQYVRRISDDIQRINDMYGYDSIAEGMMQKAEEMRQMIGRNI